MSNPNPNPNPHRGSFANYVQAACHCRPFRMCSFCRKWLKPSPKAPEKGDGR